MSSLPVSPDEQTARIDRKYWNFRRILPRAEWKSHFRDNYLIRLQSETWSYSLTLSHIGLSVGICCSLKEDAYQLYNVSIGYFGESGEAISVSRAEAKGRFFRVPNFIHRSVVDSIIQSDELFIFFMEVEKRDQEKTEKMQKLKMLEKKTQADFRDLLLSGERSDLTIRVKHKTFTCHSLILGARSPVFSAMMNQEMKEKLSSQVIVKDTEPSVFEAFLLYLYTGSEEYLNRENVVELYLLGHRYEVTDLLHLCVGFFKATITTENFYEWLPISQQYNDLELSDFITDIFLENSDDIVKSETWIEFHNMYPSESDVLLKAMDTHRVAWEQRMAPPINLEEDDYDSYQKKHCGKEEGGVKKRPSLFFGLFGM